MPALLNLVDQKYVQKIATNVPLSENNLFILMDSNGNPKKQEILFGFYHRHHHGNKNAYKGCDAFIQSRSVFGDRKFDFPIH